MSGHRGLTYDPETHAYTVDGRRVPSVTEIAGVLTAGKYAAMNPAMLEQAKRRGTAVHELCEQIDCGIDPEELDIEPELVGYVNAYLAFLRDWQPEWEWVEMPVHTDSYAGRADRIGKIDGQSAIVDIKTTSSMDRLSKLTLLLQLHAYRLAWFDMGHDAPKVLWGVQLKRDGKYTIHRGENIQKKYKLEPGAPAAIFGMLLMIAKLIGGYK